MGTLKEIVLLAFLSLTIENTTFDSSVDIQSNPIYWINQSLGIACAISQKEIAAAKKPSV